MRMEEELGELQKRTDQQGQQQDRLNSQQRGHATHLDALQELVEEQRALLAEQLRKLTDSQARTKRHQIRELEREIREMKRYVASLTDQ